MSAAVAQRPAVARAKVAAAVPTPHKPIDDFRATWEIVSNALLTAASTDEPHRHSGESDRLLRMASDLASDAANSGKRGGEAQNIAYDIAALINAARLVPGDTESVIRSHQIGIAAEHLAAIADSDVGGMIFTNVPRPDEATRKEEADYKEIAREANYEIIKLAEALQTLCHHEGTDDYPITYGIAARISMLSEVVFHAAPLHQETREQFGKREVQELRQRLKGML